MSKRYDISAPSQGKDGKTYWTRIGSFFEGDGGKRSIKLDCLPLPNKEGEVWLQVFEPREKQQGAAQAGAGQEPAPAARRGSMKPEDSDIPF
jgi:hypothetical protein